MTVSGERIKQAREIAALTQADLAREIGTNQSTITRLESNLIDNPAEIRLEAIALRTGFPLSFFRQDQGPDFPLGSLLFRKRVALTSTERARIRQLAKLIFELAEKIAAKYPIEPGAGIQRLSGSPGLVARATRDALGFSPDTPILKILSPLERNGVFVFAVPLEIPRYDAFSLWAEGATKRPVIVMSAGNPGDRQRYTLAHELGHLIMHNPRTVGSAIVEKEANEFAAEFLLPEEAMRRELTSTLSLTELAELKARWGVSIAALVMRAFSLRVATRRQVAQRFQLLNKKGWRLAEPVAIPAERPRLLRKMAEAFCGGVVDTERLGELIHAPARFIEGVLATQDGNVVNGSTILQSRPIAAPGVSSAVQPGRRVISLEGRVPKRR